MTFQDIIKSCLKEVDEVFPWDLQDILSNNSKDLILLDIREPYEFSKGSVKNSINIPRGILETACEYNYEETVPELVRSRDKEIIVICRSGNRSVLAAHTMQLMGYKTVKSLKTGVRGWNDYELPLYDLNNKVVDIEIADETLAPNVRTDQLAPV
jgi:rhodanese-related sulfurtransferase